VKLKSFIYFIIFLFFSLSLLYPQSNSSIDRLIDQGIKYERENNLEKAIETYRKILEKDNTNILVKVRLSKVLSWQNEFDEALIILDEVLKDAPHHSEALFRTAQILSWQKKYKEAIAKYQLYLIEKKDDPDALIGIARVYFWSGEYEKAIIHFDKAIQSGVDEKEARLELGKVYLSMNNKKMARLEFNKVLKIDPDNSDAKRFLKGIYISKTFEISPANLRWDIYPDNNIGISLSSIVIYHFKQMWDFTFIYEKKVNNSIPDNTFYFSSVYKGKKKLYLLGGFSFTPDPNFSPNLSTEIGIDYNPGKSLVMGFDFTADIYTDYNLFSIKPKLSKYFTDISYMTIKYNQYIHSQKYYRANLEFLLNLDYYIENPLFIKFIYGGDIENINNPKNIFSFACGISYNITENLETSLSYSWLESAYGKTHEISYSSTVKW